MGIKEELSQCESKIVIWTSPRADFVQRLSVSKLVRLLSHKRKFPRTTSNILRKVAESGLLSKVKEGNYEIYSPLLPDFVLNPVLNEEELFFVREEDARSYALRLGLQRHFRSEGRYSPPLEGSLTGVDWQVFRLKSYIEGDETPLHILLEREILTDKKKDSFSVYYPTGDSMNGRRYITPFFHPDRKRKGIETYFTSMDDAGTFANSFPLVDGKRLEVQGN